MSALTNKINTILTCINFHVTFVIDGNFILWDKVFKNRPSKICGRRRLRPYHSKFFKGCLPQILLHPFLNSLTRMIYWLHVGSQVRREFQ